MARRGRYDDTRWNGHWHRKRCRCSERSCARVRRSHCDGRRVGVHSRAAAIATVTVLVADVRGLVDGKNVEASVAD
jgi:hypothetical protein